MDRPVKEPRKRPVKSLARIRKKIAGSRHFDSLVKAMRLIASEQLATPYDLKQAAGFVAREREWQLYAIRQGHEPAVDKPVSHIEEEDEEESDDLV